MTEVVVAQRGSSLGASTLAIARRALLRFIRTPQLVVLGTIQGALFLGIFRYVFGGALDVEGVRYVDFLVPGYITGSVLFTGMGTAIAIAEDLEQGVVDRLRSLPIPRASFLAGRAVADTGLVVWSLVTTIAVGFAVGFRLHSQWNDVLGALGLLVAFGFAFTWLFIALGLFARSAQAAQGLGLLVFPLSFVSSAYVPVQTMPGWMQPFAANQPLTMMINAVRALTQGAATDVLLGHPASFYVTRSLLWCVALLVVCVPLTIARYRRM